MDAPLISQQEINAILKQPANPGFNIASPPAMVSQEIMMTDCGTSTHASLTSSWLKCWTLKPREKLPKQYYGQTQTLYLFHELFMFDADFLQCILNHR